MALRSGVAPSVRALEGHIERPGGGAVLLSEADHVPQVFRRHRLAETVPDIGGHDGVPAGGAPERC